MSDTPTVSPNAATLEDALADAETMTTRVERPEFPPLADDHTKGKGSQSAFAEIPITVVVELGRTTLSVGDLYGLGVGSVVELDRLIESPADLTANGYRIARGDIVVVNDSFALRITEVIKANVERSMHDAG